jgi:hypothetical protein
MELIKKTVKEVYEAIKLNGLDQIRETWVHTDDDGNIVAGCIIMQGAFNLKVVPSDEVEDEPWETEYDYENTLLGQLNILSVPEGKYSKIIGKSIRGVGDAIIHWYDEVNPNFRDEYDAEGNPINYYYLSTYEDALKMVKTLLEPYFDRTLKLATVNSFAL